MQFILATGGPGVIFGKCTASTICNGSAVSDVYQEGAYLGNVEFIQIHPTAIPGEDKNRLMSEAARGEGGRVWTYKDGKPWYFLEEKYPAYGNLVPRDIAAREIYQVCVHMGLGINGENRVYLDLSHIDADYLNRKLAGIMEIYEEFVGDDPRKVPMQIFPSVHYSMGGIWVDRKHRTNIPGLFASGECDYQYMVLTVLVLTPFFPLLILVLFLVQKLFVGLTVIPLGQLKVKLLLKTMVLLLLMQNLLQQNNRLLMNLKKS